MNSLRKITRLLIAFFLLCALAHCSTARKDTSPLADQKREQPAEDAKKTESPAPKESSKEMEASRHLDLARAYFSHKNPDRNYQQALKELELYLSLNPAAGEDEEIRDLLAVLSEFDKAFDENKRSKQKITQLTKENKELRDAVEKLKRLDIRMEEKRKQIK